MTTIDSLLDRIEQVYHTPMAGQLRVEIGLMRAELERLRKQVSDLENDHKARSAIDPVTRLHNICDALAESSADFPYTQEAWDAQDDAYREKCAEVERLRADAERYRWLRSRFRVFGPHIDGNHAWCATGDIGRLRGPSLDAAIDAAIAAKGE